MFQEIQSLLPGRISIRRGRSKLLHPLAMQEKWRKMFLILRCSVPPEIMTGFCLPCFVRFYCTVVILKIFKYLKTMFLCTMCTHEDTKSTVYYKEIWPYLRVYREDICKKMWALLNNTFSRIHA